LTILHSGRTLLGPLSGIWEARHIDQFSESFVRDRQIYIARLADALTRPGKQRDLNAAAGLGMQSLDLAESLESNTGTGHLGDLYYRMKQYPMVPAVRDFLERAKGLVGV
jgi:hypothetical protein